MNTLLVQRSASHTDKAAAAGQPAISVVIPVQERPQPLADLYHEYSSPLVQTGRVFEFVFVVDPHSHHLAQPLSVLIRGGAPIRILELGQVATEASLVKAAAVECKGATIVLLPPYHRVEARSVLDLISRLENGQDLVTARRWPRRDPFANRLQSRCFHWIVGRLIGGNFEDVGSGVRVVRRDVLQQLPLYGDFSRFLPVIAAKEGYRVEEVAVPQHSGDRATRLYSPGIYVRRLLDLVGIFFLVRFTEKPLRLFGLMGATLSGLGGLLLTVMTVQRIGGRALSDRPLLLLGVLLLALGMQAIALGLVGEIIVHFSSRRAPLYRVRSDLNS